jgi:nucleotide-binding universal stress UspA family protein
MADVLSSTQRIESLLVPLDGSRMAEAAIAPAIAIAGALPASVVVLHVLEHEPPGTIHGEPHLDEQAGAEHYLAGVAERFRDAGIDVHTHVHDNPERDVAASIVQHAAELESDLVVLANHGSGGLRGFLYGRVAQQVLRRGDRPVLMVPVATSPAEVRPFTCQRIAIFLSGANEAESALPMVARLASAFGAEVWLIRAVPTVATLSGEGAATATLVPAASRAVLDLEAEEAASYLAGVAAELGRQGVPVKRSIVRGDPASAAVAEAIRVEADILVMATHGRLGLSGIWAGSVGTKVLGRFDRPLVLVRSPR